MTDSVSKCYMSDAEADAFIAGMQGVAEREPLRISPVYSIDPFDQLALNSISKYGTPLVRCPVCPCYMKSKSTRKNSVFLDYRHYWCKHCGSKLFLEIEKQPLFPRYADSVKFIRENFKTSHVRRYFKAIKQFFIQQQSEESACIKKLELQLAHIENKLKQAKARQAKAQKDYDLLLEIAYDESTLNISEYELNYMHGLNRDLK
ncbi:hypothetical protein [uncultured Deefgea sp.]|uniref:hypothetical protein n=1 Tax=uncultured Deefgea sp. TaxID=1304914 RepID=UPI0025989628|nr:hypothetical protein [uncultured Deefgea sp.]